MRVILYTEVFTSSWVFDSVNISSDLKFDIDRLTNIIYNRIGKSPTFVRIYYIVTDSDLVHSVSKNVLINFCKKKIKRHEYVSFNKLLELYAK